jgi:hypothetical protein
VIKAALFLVIVSAPALGSPALERPHREDTIYVLQGDLPRLEAFATKMSDWEGGELIEKDAKSKAFYFWAYSERTASQARQFLMPAAFSGLSLEIQSYDQVLAYPELRKSADTVAAACDVRVDPFFVAPTGRVRFRPAPTMSVDQSACVLKGALASQEVGPLLDIIGNEAVADESE